MAVVPDPCPLVGGPLVGGVGGAGADGRDGAVGVTLSDPLQALRTAARTSGSSRFLVFLMNLSPSSFPVCQVYALGTKPLEALPSGCECGNRQEKGS
jgi:hypothetical protein